MSESLMRMLAELPAAEPEPERAEGIRRRCHSRLVRQAARASRSTFTFAPAWRVFVSMLGAAYLIVAILEAVRVYRFF
jgi:hypothetical protein